MGVLLVADAASYVFCCRARSIPMHVGYIGAASSLESCCDLGLYDRQFYPVLFCVDRIMKFLLLYVVCLRISFFWFQAAEANLHGLLINTPLHVKLASSQIYRPSYLTRRPFHTFLEPDRLNNEMKTQLHLFCLKG